MSYEVTTRHYIGCRECYRRVLGSWRFWMGLRGSMGVLVESRGKGEGEGGPWGSAFLL